MNFDIKQFAKANAKKSKTDIKYLRFKRERHPSAFRLIAEYNRSLDLESLVDAFIKKEVLPKLNVKA